MSALGFALAVVAGIIGSLSVVAYLIETWLGGFTFLFPPAEWLGIGILGVALALVAWVAL